MTGRCVFVTGATGYVGRALIPALLRRGHRVRALSRAASAARVPPGAEVILGDALVAASFAAAIVPADTLVHLVGTPHPSPAKAASFRAIDLVSAHAALDAALAAGVRHFVYVSVAQPAPVMHAYIEARQAAEARIRSSGIAATIVRPWYVLGPGHRWPYVLLPVYAVLARLPATRDSAQRLGLVTLAQMVAALVASIERGPDGERVLNVPDIRAARAA
ncbi:MAG TPA: NAD(P)H-binding protein [Steroidobacteraceae bacterium]|nr:NAD(P)H-binding protein [Steroidobacteraceae bacterium]